MKNSELAILGVIALLCFVPPAFAAEGDNPALAGAKESAGAAAPADAAADKKPDEAKKPDDAKPEEAAKPDAKPDEAAGKKPDEAKPDKPAEAAGGEPSDEAPGGATGDSQPGVALKDLVNDGFVIRTTVFVPADAVTRQVGRLSLDGMVLTLQKSTSTAVCYYLLSAYVDPGLTNIKSCTVHR